MTVIEREFGIPRSTLSGWFKEVPLTEAQRTKLMQNSYDGWKKAREKAVITKNLQKAQRIALAEKEAKKIYNNLPKDSLEVLELSLAMLYFGEGGKNDSTNMGSADPSMLTFFIKSIEMLYGIDRMTFRYDLHLRYDQDLNIQKKFWASKLQIPIEKIGYVSKDARTIGKPTRANYPGVCQIRIGSIAIQRRLIALYNIYCNEIIKGG
jgi:hypothetical protein